LDWGLYPYYNEISNTKYQIPNSKYQISNTKFQTSNSKDIEVWL